MFITNLHCSSAAQVMDWSAGDLLPLLEECLDPSLTHQGVTRQAPTPSQQPPAAAAAAGSSGDAMQVEQLPGSCPSHLQQLPSSCPSQEQQPQGEALRAHALYCVVNVAAGDEGHKAALMASHIPLLLLHHLREVPASEVRARACARLRASGFRVFGRRGLSKWVWGLSVNGM